MNKSIVRVGLFGLIAAAAMGLGGCNNNLKEENAALREDKAKLEGNNTELTNKLAQSETARGEAESKAAQSQGTISQLQTQLAEKNNNQGPGFTPNDGSNGGGKSPRGPKGGTEKDVTLVVAGDVLFSPGSATLTAGGKKEIDKVISTLKSKYGGHTIRVEGYTDSDPITKAKDKFPTNKALSQARADAVEHYMSTKGISASRISAVGMGAAKPKETKAASRRVEIVVVGNGN
jgi:outer membrane protein OmpA-like peptidoglycan-associated protein